MKKQPPKQMRVTSAFSLELAHLLTEAREAKGLTQQDVAYMIGCTVGQISRYERGLNSPSLEKFPVLCRTLGLNPGTVLLELARKAPKK